MKKVLLTAFAVTCAASVFAQGTVVFNNRITGTLVTHVYYGGNAQKVGNGPTDTASGTTDWTGYSLVGATLNGQYGASTTFAQLLGASGAGVSESALAPVSTTLTFRSGTAAGFLAGNTATLTGIAKDAPAATLEMAVWDNSSGLYSSWTQAKTAWDAGLIMAGKSGAFNVSAIGGDFNTPPYLTGLQSFNIYYNVPEPSTMALAGLGAAALLIFRRRK